MEVLDRVYNAFSNLERDFGRSKKSRTAFITDKFGGDIDVGSMIILDSISIGSDDYSAEDIEKLTFVKDTIDAIKRLEGKYDQLASFNALSGVDPATELFDMLDKADMRGKHIKPVTQKELRRLYPGTVHYDCNQFGGEYTPLSSCKVFHIYNGHMENLFRSCFNVQTALEKGSYMTIKSGGRCARVSEGKLSSVLE